MGEAFYVSRVPERWKPGTFDIAGHGHQIFRVFVVLGALVHCVATLLIVDFSQQLNTVRYVNFVSHLVKKYLMSPFFYIHDVFAKYDMDHQNPKPICGTCSSIKLVFFCKSIRDMVGRSYSLNMGGVESIDLRIALYETKEDVQRLQEELDAEREATASSASEAMSMILRLQGEKAALAMEASQYKRMVEERMSHAELSFDLLEDLNYQKDAEIKNLESRLYAYKCKLLSLGCSGTDDDHSYNDMRCCDRSQTPSPEPIDTDLLVPVEKEVIEQSLDSSRRHQEKNLDLYWDQIKKLDEQLKELAEFRDSIRMETFSVSETKDGETGEAFVASSSNIQGIVAKEKAKGLCKSDFMAKKMSKKSSKQKKNRSAKRENVQGSCSAIDAAYQAELQRLKERVERLERERFNTEPQTSEVKQEEELSSVQADDMKNTGTTQTLLPCYDSAIVPVQEAMLYFWL